jgi:hypothetical protein
MSHGLTVPTGAHARWPHPRDPGRHLARPGGVNSEPPIPLLGHNAACAFLPVVTTGGIGARSGVDAGRAR